MAEGGRGRGAHLLRGVDEVGVQPLDCHLQVVDEPASKPQRCWVGHVQSDDEVGLCLPWNTAPSVRSSGKHSATELVRCLAGAKEHTGHSAAR